MKAKQKPGVIINMGSAAGLYPMTFDPIYSAAKGFVLTCLFLIYFHMFIVVFIFSNVLPFLQAVLCYLLDH